MEGSTFDQLSRRLASFGSRRQAIKTVAGMVIAAAAGGRAAGAQSCTAQYRPCQSDGQCCAGAVCQSGICQPGCRIDGLFRSASTPQPGNTCARCAPAISTSAWSPANEGMACWSGAANLCGGPSTCQSGACQATSAVTCQPLTPCHVAGECNPNTGLCSNPPAPAGAPCGGGETCLGGFHSPGLACNGSGSCAAGATVPCAPFTCGETQCRTSCDNDAHCATGAVCRESECLYPRANGQTCAVDHECAGYHCVAGICCDTACESFCSVCPTGTCQPKQCSDGKSCTTDTCNEANGDCEHTHDTSTNTCYINETCYNAGAENLSNRCEVCDPARSTSSWSPKLCEALTCTTVACNSSTGQCEQTHDTGTNTCYINGVCYNPDAENLPTNRCEVCDPARLTSSWSSKLCEDDDLTCTITACNPATGQCEYPHDPTTDTCLIGGDCYEAGAPFGNGSCSYCDPDRDRTGWSLVPEGSPCFYSSPACQNGTLRTSSSCTSQGACIVTFSICGAYVCSADGAACLTSCSDDSHCASGAVCGGNVCQFPGGPGTQCVADIHCLAGHICANWPPNVPPFQCVAG